MAAEQLDTDYLIAGCGAVGMAFADVLLEETDADIVIVDRHDKPGGHWNDAYPFVTLHQPSQYYGVSSKELSQGHKDQVGWNQGLGDLASGAEVLAYFDDVMRQHFLPSGRVRYFPMCDYQGEGNFTSRLTGQQRNVSFRKKFVNATFLNTSVPSTHRPNFEIGDGVNFVPLNELPKVEKPPRGFVVIGGGKTGIDACLWLLSHEVDPDQIQWIVPRDAWLLDRRNTQPAAEFFQYSMGGYANQMEAIAAATSPDDLFSRLEKCGYLLRIDPSVQPTMFHGATVSELELEQLRRIKQVIRRGRVRSLEADQILLEQGQLPTSPEHLHIDCSARALPNLDTKPIFDGRTVTPQTVRAYQPIFSAAFIAHVEASYQDEAQQNHLCGVVPLPNTLDDYLRFTAANMMNQYRWSQDKGLSEWLMNNRLDGFGRLARSIDPNDSGQVEIMQRLSRNAGPAMEKLNQLISQM